MVSRNYVLLNGGFKDVLKMFLRLKFLSWEWMSLGVKGMMILIFPLGEVVHYFGFRGDYNVLIGDLLVDRVLFLCFALYNLLISSSNTFSSN